MASLTGKSGTVSGARRWRLALGVCAALCAGMVALTALAPPAEALRVSMKRIVFEGPVRSDVITIINNSAEEQTYRLGWKRYKMTEDRALVSLEDDEDAEGVEWAEEMVRFAPRRVTVPAGASQQIRLLLRRPRDLPTGEYRAHLWIVTEEKPREFVPDDSETQTTHSVRLSMLPAVSMPVFVRNGNLTAAARISDLAVRHISGTEGRVNMMLHRDGDRSLYGDVRVVCTGSGSEYVAHETRGLAVYTEVNRRAVNVTYRFPAEQAANCRTVRVEYKADNDDRQYGGQVMAQATASIN